jgi:DNA-binding response OmpR family regulator
MFWRALFSAWLLLFPEYMGIVRSDSVSSPTILVVDDNAEMVEFLNIYLSRHGMRVLSAYSGRQCLELASRQLIDVVVLDVMMPEMSGLEICRTLKALPATRDIPVLFLTAKDDSDTRLAGIKLGICEFLTKPIRGRELLERIHLQLAVRQWERELDQLSRGTAVDELQM